MTAVIAAAALAGALLPVVADGDRADAASVVLTATDTAWTTVRQPDQVQNHDYLSATATQDRTYLKFSGADLDGLTVTSAVLEVSVRATNSTRPGLVAARTSADWTSRSLTHAGRPAAGAAVSDPSGTARAGEVLRIPLDLSAVSSTGDFALSLNHTQRGIRLQLDRSGDLAPRLVISTSADPSETPAPAPLPAPPDKPADAPTVFAHYFTPYPLSLENDPPASDYYARNYLRPEGENGKFADVGGLLRDRPISPPPSESATWRVDNLVTETRQAKSAGIDGWALNLMSTAGRNWDASVNLMRAAELVGDFTVVPMVDGSSGFAEASPATAARLLDELYESSAAHREGGEYLLSSFKAEEPAVSWWRSVIDILEQQYHRPISFQAVFLNASEANMDAFAAIADGYGNWGSRSVRSAQNHPDYTARSQARGKTWMEPVTVQDVRPRSLLWAESLNTASVRAQWERAIDEEPEYVQLVTWNDYSESTQIAPSMAHGTAFLDLTRYYTDWYHTGAQPPIAADEIVLTHRIQFVAAEPTYDHRLLGAPNLDGSSTAPRDAVEALVWLTAPATVEITVGGVTTSVAAPAGVSAHTVPLALGEVSARVVRSGRATASVASPHDVVARPYVQDLQYYAASTW